MIQRFLFATALLFFAGGILITSILRTASPSLAYSQNATAAPRTNQESEQIDYYLAYPGILPDHFLWPVKAVRDNIWLFLTTDPLKKAELFLLLADKRIGAAEVLMAGGKPELAVSSATAAGKYLEEAFKTEETARNKGADVDKFLDRLSLAALKHRERFEGLKIQAPEGLKSQILDAMEYPKKVSEDLKGVFNYIKKPLRPSPFE